MNAIEPQLADEPLAATLSRAKALIEGSELDSAAHIYLKLLDSALTDAVRGEVLTNLGATLCLLARTQEGPAAQARLDQARDLLVSALPHRQRASAPAAWATTRANLALVHLARYEASGNSDELLSAHMALDGLEQTLRHTDDAALHDWVAAIRDQLLELRDRRGKRR